MSTGVLMMAVGSAAAMSCAIVKGTYMEAHFARRHGDRPVLDGGSSCLAADHERAAACPVHEDCEILLLQRSEVSPVAAAAHLPLPECRTRRIFDGDLLGQEHPCHR